MVVRHTRSATRHRISRESSRHVVEKTGVVFGEAAPAGSGLLDPRLVFLGPDRHGVLLEVMAVEVGGGGLLVIHAQPIRPRYESLLEGGL